MASAIGRSVVWGTRFSKGPKSRRVYGALLAAAMLLMSAPAHEALASDPADSGGPKVKVIVTSDSADGARGKLKDKHSKIDADLPSVNGVEAEVSPGDLAALAADPTVTVTQNAPVFFTDLTTAAVTTRAPAAVFPQATGASSLVAGGTDGTGVNVAVLDTGIDPLPDFGNRLVAGVDLSGEGNPFQDSYGHGTFVAGLIAGNGTSSAGAYMGEAPGAGLVSVKVAGASGATDLATVLSGIQWVVANQPSLNIRVLNLSLGQVPITSSMLNPLDKAVESAWRVGIVVVASAGNAGPFNGTILAPGDDPLVITVGALDDNGTAAATDDASPAFSSVGPTSVDGWIKPDLLASGRSVVSLRAPGSTVDLVNPTAEVGPANFVGSGTSFSAAITSGAAALIVQGHPATEPNRVKARLLGTAGPGPTGNPFVDGHGSLNALAAASTTPARVQQAARPWAPPAPGTPASLQNSWQVSAWNPANWSGVNPDGSAWNGSAWASVGWNGSAWNSTAWNGSAWNGSAWNGSAWNGSAWNGSAWNGSAWNGSAWNGSAWNGSAWNGSAWNGSAWN